MKPFISVIITAYNRDKYVNKAIESVLNQTLDRDKFEILVVTNMDLPEREGVRIIKSNERNLGAMIAQGILNSEGDIVSLLDDDDLFLPNKLEVVYNIFNKHDISLFHNEMYFIDDNWNRIEKLERNREKAVRKYLREEPVSYTFLRKNLIDKIKLSFNASSVSFRKNVLINYLDNLNGIIHQSIETIIFFLAAYKNNIILSPQKLTYYRVHSFNISKVYIDGKINKKIISYSFEQYPIIRKLREVNEFFKIIDYDYYLYLRVFEDDEYSTSFIKALESVLGLMKEDFHSAIRRYTLIRNFIALLPKQIRKRLALEIIKRFSAP